MSGSLFPSEFWPLFLFPSSLNHLCLTWCKSRFSEVNFLWFPEINPPSPERSWEDQTRGHPNPASNYWKTLIIQGILRITGHNRIQTSHKPANTFYDTTARLAESGHTLAAVLGDNAWWSPSIRETEVKVNPPPHGGWRLSCFWKFQSRRDRKKQVDKQLLLFFGVFTARCCWQYRDPPQYKWVEA